MNLFRRCILVFLFASIWSSHVSAQDDGARAYMPAPAGMNVFIALGVSIDGNRSGDPSTIIEGADLSLDSVAPMYSRTFAFAGKPASFFAVLPYGRVGGRVRTTMGDLTASSEGFADFTFGTAFTLLGAPPVTAAEYVAFKPTSSLGLLLKVSAPTGQYDASRPLNLGGNRWMLQVGAPITFYAGSSLVDPGLLTFEIMPSVAVFTENDDLASAGSSQQEALYRIEAHITKSFRGKHFISLDSLFTQGGAVETDGVETGGSQRALALGATYSYSPDAANTVRVTYGKNVSRSDSGMEGDLIRAFWIRAF